MQRVVLWLLLLALALALAVFISRDPENAIRALDTHDIAALLLQVGTVVLIAGSVLSLLRDRFAQALQAVAIWLVIGVLLALGYTFRTELTDVYERVMAEFVPGRAVSHGTMVEIVRGQAGEFQIAAEVNGTRMPMVLDTGATTVVLTNEAARAAGLPLELVKYTVNIETANGRAHAAAVTLDRIAIGGITERAVPALIAQPGQLRTNLLGMTFLNRLQSWEVRGEKLVMRGYP